MSKIELSAGMASGLPGRMLLVGSAGYNSQSPGWRVGLLQVWNGPYTPEAKILLMKGTVPASVTELTTTSSRSTDILATFNATSGHFSPSIQTANPATINTLYVSATAAGTVTWFKWLVADQYGTIYHQIVGTVGALGSGADLEMVSTTLAVGDQTRISNFRIAFPTSWTY